MVAERLPHLGLMSEMAGNENRMVRGGGGGKAAQW